MINFIGELVQGDQVTLIAGIGMPETQEEITEVIVRVSGGSALTNSGRRLAQCADDNWGITLTGRNLTEKEYALSEEARQIIAEVEGEHE
ncbi:MAG: hypothetical protein QY314_02950 [Candidatus Dojkabacteria bacterium]|nr:MAG: hypothetical protein QY314_02950 [Candidatus Dojkabacteria bacterium]